MAVIDRTPPTFLIINLSLDLPTIAFFVQFGLHHLWTFVAVKS